MIRSDAPGLNAVIQAATIAATRLGWEVFGYVKAIPEFFIRQTTPTEAAFLSRQGMDGVMVALQPPRIQFVPIAEAIAKMKQVPLDGEGVLTARALDICLGD